MQMIICEPLFGAIRPYPASWNDFFREASVTLDLLRRIEEVVADAVDVDGRAPAMRRCRGRKRVLRRTVSTIGRNMDEGVRRLAEQLQMRRERCNCARYVPRERPQGLSFPNIHRQKLPKRKIFCKLNRLSGLPRIDFEKESRQPARSPGS